MKGVMGRPKTDAPKNKLLQVRMDEGMMQLLDQCAEQRRTTRAEIVREGIQLVSRTIEEEKGNG